MKLKKTLFVSFAAAMALAGGAASAHAGEAKFNNDTQILPCPNVEAVSLLGNLLGNDTNNLDCSRNYKEEVEIKKVTKIEKDEKFSFAPKFAQLQGQAQGQEQDAKSKQGQKHDEREYDRDHDKKDDKDDKDYDKKD